MGSSLTAAERTTTYSWDDEGDNAYVTTYNRSEITKLRANPAAREVTVETVRHYNGAEFILPKKLVSVRKPTKSGAERKPRAPMTQEHKDKLQAGRLAKKARANA